MRWKSRGPLKKSREMARKLICSKTKNNIPNFLNQRYIEYGESLFLVYNVYNQIFSDYTTDYAYIFFILDRPFDPKPKYVFDNNGLFML